jgi:dCTP deaminase
MILSASEVERRISAGDLVIRPYGEECQQPASYDLRSAEEVTLSRGRCTLIHSLEWVELPADIAATLRCRSSFGRRGILIGGGFVDPGFRGNLTLSLVNMGDEDLVLNEGERVVQMIMHHVSDGNRLYGGRYQDSRGVVMSR